ncbi:MAG TPA: hypothetical protein VF042_11935, partial [Gemmatimonadaceae bacterium]
IDIYAVGLLAYELLTGESPFTGPSPAATMAAQLTRVPEPLYQCCPDVPPPLSAIIMQCLAKEPNDRPPTAEALMSALDAITTSSGDVKTASTKVLPSVSNRRRQMTISAGVATVALASAVVVFAYSGRGTRPNAAPSSKAAASGGATAIVPPVIPQPAVPKPATKPAPLQLTAADSLAIAEAVQKRIAREEAIHGRQQVTMFADSIAAVARKVAIDSIIRANLPRGAQMPVFAELGAIPPEWSAKRRVVVTEPRASRNENLNAFGSVVSENIRNALMKRKGYTVVDPDSVALLLTKTRVRTDIERAFKPDLLISTSFAGVGDTMTVLVTARDLRRGGGARVASAKFAVNNAEVVVPELVSNLVKQIESMRLTAIRVNPAANFQFREFKKDSFMTKR